MNKPKLHHIPKMGFKISVYTYLNYEPFPYVVKVVDEDDTILAHYGCTDLADLVNSLVRELNLAEPDKVRKLITMPREV